MTLINLPPLGDQLIAIILMDMYEQFLPSTISDSPISFLVHSASRGFFQSYCSYFALDLVHIH